MLRKLRRGQTTLEYAVLVVIVIAALLSLQVYIKRGLQGRFRSSTDDIGDQFTTANGVKFNKRVLTHSKAKDTMLEGVTQSKVDDGAYTNTEEHVLLPREGVEYDPAEGLAGGDQSAK